MINGGPRWRRRAASEVNDVRDVDFWVDGDKVVHVGIHAAAAAGVACIPSWAGVVEGALRRHWGHYW